MIVSRRHLLLAGMLAGFMPLAALGQGLVWESTITINQKSEAQTSYFMPKMYKQSNPSGNDVIIRLDREVLITVDHPRKTYSEVTFAELETAMKKMGSKMDDAMAQMKEKMKDMSPEERAMMEKMMGGTIPGMGTGGAVTVKEADERKKIGSWSCRRYVINRGEKQFMEIWTTGDVKDFAAMRKDWEQYSRRLAALTPAMGKEMAESFSKIDGFPIQTRADFFTNTVTRIERKSTPAGDFNPPAGYTKTASPLLEQMESSGGME